MGRVPWGMSAFARALPASPQRSTMSSVRIALPCLAPPSMQHQATGAKATQGTRPSARPAPAVGKVGACVPQGLQCAHLMGWGGWDGVDGMGRSLEAHICAHTCIRALPPLARWGVCEVCSDCTQ